MSLKNCLSLLVITFIVFSFAGNVHARTCGTSLAAHHQRELRENKSISKKPIPRKAYTGCPSSDYYDTVLTQKTEHFQIFYTLSGPNQTTKEFVDTLAKDVEYAYQFYTKQMGMLPPLGNDTSFHYQQVVDKDLYPVEVIDVDLLRDTEFYLGGSCNGCFGVTISEDYSTGKTTLVIDNDFLYTTSRSGNSTQDTIKVDGKNCIYNIADQELRNEAHDYSYADKWENAIRVTSIHELYHAVQLRYMDFTYYGSFWFEASASGVEEIAASDIDDYYSYLPTMSKSVGTPLDKMIEDYGAGIFFIYLYNHISPSTDKFIWESFSKNPNDSFWLILKKYAEKKKLSADSIFQDFAVKLSFSGSRSKLLDSTQWISSDEKNWPEFKHVQHTSELDEYSPNTEKHAYKFHNGGKPIFEKFEGKATAIAYTSETTQIKHIKTTNMADSLYIAWNKNSSVDSIIWVFSRYENDATIPTAIDERPSRAYPSPWRRGNLCFASLPENKKFIEIRNRRGDLVLREDYEFQAHCIDENRVKKLMVPGVYRFRAGSSGKTKDFIVIY